LAWRALHNGLLHIFIWVCFAPVKIQISFLADLHQAVYALYIYISFDAYFEYILQNNSKHQNSWNMLDKRPILLRYILFVVILIYFGGQNIWVNDRQQYPTSGTHEDSKYSKNDYDWQILQMVPW
jgi:hypothetical protein